MVALPVEALQDPCGLPGTPITADENRKSYARPFS
jgi:hypothetical protein